MVFFLRVLGCAALGMTSFSGETGLRAYGCEPAIPMGALEMRRSGFQHSGAEFDGRADEFSAFFL